MLKQVAEMKYKLSACISIPTKIKCMHSLCVLSQLLLSMLYIAIPTTVGPQLSKPRLSEPSIIQTVRLTVLLEYFDSKCMFY